MNEDEAILQVLDILSREKEGEDYIRKDKPIKVRDVRNTVKSQFALDIKPFCIEEVAKAIGFNITRIEEGYSAIEVTEAQLSKLLPVDSYGNRMRRDI